jgi:histone acetyltransferase (RNA polymerase elongator complex component)
MFEQALYNHLLQFDDVKIYPTAVCQSHNNDKFNVTSEIQKWYNEGSYQPYAEKNLADLIEVLKFYKTNIQPWIRIQRLVRDIPKQSIQAGYERISNLRQIITDQMKAEGKRCRCIRCNEIGYDDEKEGILTVRCYNASEGQEYYISYETYKETFWFWVKYFLFLLKYYVVLLILGQETYFGGDLNCYDGLIGFCRLRFDSNPGGGFIKELEDCAMIREVHVYGHSLGLRPERSSLGLRPEQSSLGLQPEQGSLNPQKNFSTQHKGYGRKLVKTAEKIAKDKGYKKIAVISGVGTREYYKKLGYSLEETYMIKNII